MCLFFLDSGDCSLESPGEDGDGGLDDNELELLSVSELCGSLLIVIGHPADNCLDIGPAERVLFSVGKKKVVVWKWKERKKENRLWRGPAWPLYNNGNDQ